MSLNQFFITFIIALLLGVLISNTGKILFKKIVSIYRTLTFRHVLLTPYTPKKQKRDSQ